MVISAHPDDAELTCAGTVRKATAAGKSVVFVDCTRGELGTRGTPELREKEATEAASILGVEIRENLGYAGWGRWHKHKRTFSTWSPRSALISHGSFSPLRNWNVIPDHEAVHRLVRAATFSAGLHKVNTERDGVEQEPHRPQRTLTFMQWFDLPGGPDVYVDITDVYDDRTKAILAFASQFHLPDTYDTDEPQTFLSRPEFLEELDARAIHFGSRIGVRYAEAFKAVEPLALDSISDLL